MIIFFFHHVRYNFPVIEEHQILTKSRYDLLMSGDILHVPQVLHHPNFQYE